MAERLSSYFDDIQVMRPIHFAHGKTVTSHQIVGPDGLRVNQRIHVNAKKSW